MKTRKIEINTEASCRNCQGTGWDSRLGKDCNICEGNGTVNVNKVINITITPLKKNVKPNNLENE